MRRIYQVEIFCVTKKNDTKIFPTRVTASSYGTAAGKAWKEFRKTEKGKRFRSFRIELKDQGRISKTASNEPAVLDDDVTENYA